MRRHSIAHTACLVVAKDPRMTLTCRSLGFVGIKCKDDRRNKSVFRSAATHKRTAHATQRGARGREGELMKCRKKAGANCCFEAHSETRRPAVQSALCGYLGPRPFSRAHPQFPFAQPTKPLVLLPPPLPTSIRSAVCCTPLRSWPTEPAVSLLVAHLARVGSIKNVATTLKPAPVAMLML